MATIGRNPFALLVDDSNDEGEHVEVAAPVKRVANAGAKKHSSTTTTTTTTTTGAGNKSGQQQVKAPAKAKPAAAGAQNGEVPGILPSTHSHSGKNNIHVFVVFIVVVNGV